MNLGEFAWARMYGGEAEHVPPRSQAWTLDDERELRERCPWLKPAPGQIDPLDDETMPESLGDDMKHGIAASVADDPAFWGRVIRSALRAR